jgi:hypothetical protein
MIANNSMPKIVGQYDELSNPAKNCGGKWG